MGGWDQQEHKRDADCDGRNQKPDAPMFAANQCSIPLGAQYISGKEKTLIKESLR